MAGGIDWFRWHHGSVTDPKFPLIARRAGARLGDVVTVWAFALEQASAAVERGATGDLDCEALDCMLGAEDGTTARILAAMEDRGLVADGVICNWAKRQPKKEDETANERKRRQREREHEASIAASEASVTAEESRDVTQCHADVTPSHARGEERREEKKEEISKPTASQSAEPTRATKPSIPCPYSEIVELYHSRLPDLPRCRLMPASREKAIRRLWGWVLSSSKSDGTRRATCADEALAWIDGYFRRASENDFLMGRSGRSSGHENWRCDIDFLMTDKGMRHVIEKTLEAA